jgi:hypothetical protein
MLRVWCRRPLGLHPSRASTSFNLTGLVSVFINEDTYNVTYAWLDIPAHSRMHMGHKHPEQVRWPGLKSGLGPAIACVEDY